MSPLLRELPAAPHDGGHCADSGAADLPVFSLERALAALAPSLEHWRDDRGTPWPQDAALRGGARLLELQSLCPFRSFAELRLAARPVRAPMPGVEMHQRGRIVHRALELFWRATREASTLQRRSGEESLQLAHECARRAVEEIGMALPRSLQSALLAHEQLRTVALIERLLEWERGRAAFSNQELEAGHVLTVAGAQLRLRLDRVDRLADGRLVVMDYKTGRPHGFDPYAARPRQPQLPAYSVVAGNGVAAVLAVYLAPDGIKLEGIADRPDRLQRLAKAADGEAAWLELRRFWDHGVQQLAQEFLAGDASVTPQPQACDHCHLQLLCRVAAAASEAIPEGAELPTAAVQ